MRKYILTLTLLYSVAFAGIDSSIDIPTDKHQKYTVGNQKNHPAIKLEGERYFANLAKIKKEEIGRIVAKNEMSILSISLVDLYGELVYRVFAKDGIGKKYKLYIDAGNGKILQKQAV